MGAPFGRDPAGQPYSQHEYAQRFNLAGPDPGQHWHLFASDDGAVPGTKVVITDGDEFKRVFGTYLDRIGEADGKFLSVMENGVPPSWEERALHVDSLVGPYSTYDFGELPKGWSVEVSEVEPALGQPGGAIQVRVLNSNRKVMSIDQLILEGVLK